MIKNKLLVALTVSILCLVSCTSNVQERYRSNSSLFENAVDEIQNNYGKYDTLISSKFTDGSYPINLRILPDSILSTDNPLTSLFQENEDVEMIIYSPEEIWFRRMKKPALINPTHEILIYTGDSTKSYAHHLDHRYSKDYSLEKINQFWVYAEGIKTFD